jgi:hypothetical protein
VIIICAIIAVIAIVVFLFELWMRARQKKKIHDGEQQRVLNVFTMQAPMMEDTVGIVDAEQLSEVTTTPSPPMQKVVANRRRIKVPREILYDIDMLY